MSVLQHCKNISILFRLNSFFIIFRYDWFQTDATVNIVVYTKRKVGKVQLVMWLSSLRCKRRKVRKVKHYCFPLSRFPAPAVRLWIYRVRLFGWRCSWGRCRIFSTGVSLSPATHTLTLLCIC